MSTRRTRASVPGDHTEAATPRPPSPARSPSPSPLSKRISELFDTVRKADGTRYSLREVAAGITAATGVTVSVSTIWQLRHGGQDNPTLATLRGVAGFFGVPVQYLVPDDGDPGGTDPHALATAAQLHANPELHHLLIRARGLTPDNLHLLDELLTRIRQSQGLPDIPPDLGGQPPPPASATRPRRQRR